ncbi:MAG: hydroxymethylbilane synthase [Thermoguttaceae bacterium]|nr:hydroxymethylbilane synthase [Thermoguttaceae bacterium]
MSTIRIATRQSALAKWQADWVASQLERLSCNVEMVYVTTHGDVNQSGPIESIGTQGVFTKEVQKALLDNRADVAVHSMKDLPTMQAPGLVLAAVPPRAPTADCLVSPYYNSLDELPDDAVIGTGSLRRKAQLLAINPKWNIQPIRGNLQTRLNKVFGERTMSANNNDSSYFGRVIPATRKQPSVLFDAIILAEAGLRRMGFDAQIAQVIPLTQLMPAAGQGALALECRAGDESTLAAVGQLNSPDVYASTVAERTLLAVLEAGCLAPVGCTTRILTGYNSQSVQIELTGRVIAADGSKTLEQTDCADAQSAEELGRRVAQRLLASGADKLIAESRNS